MKKNLEILKIEPKLDKNEKKYWRVNTSEGWMSCWEKDTAEILKEFDGGECCVEIAEKEGKNFKGEKTTFLNITKCYGDPEEIEEDGTGKPEVEVQKISVEKPKINPYEKCPVGLAVEIFCSIISKGEATQQYDGKVIMDECIELVKQAREAFE